MFSLSSIYSQTIKNYTLGEKAQKKEFDRTLGWVSGTMSLSVIDNNILGSIKFDVKDVDRTQLEFS